MAKQKCPICKKEYDDIISLGAHMEKKHIDEFIDKEWSGVKYLFYLKHGRTTGTCIVCKGKTKFNESTGKPNRICDNPLCRKKLRENALNNMRKKYGKDTLLNDPEFQVKMLNNRKITKEYKWSDGSSIKKCVGSYEYDCVRFLDVLLGLESNDVLVPAPFIFDYQYDGKTHFYIPDIYISSLNLLIECKDGKENPNTHPKIQAVDKVKEKLKEEAVKKSGKYNYIKVMNKEYGNLLQGIIDLKKQENIKEPKPLFINEMVNLVNLSEEYTYKPDIIEIVLFHDKDIDFINQIGLLCNKKIYFKGENVSIISSDETIIEKRYKINLPKEELKIIADSINDYINIPMDEMTPQNFPGLIIYYCLYYTDADIVLGDVIDLYNFDEYRKLPWIIPIDPVEENAFKNLLEPDIIEEYYLTDKVLPDKIKEKNNYPIKGLPIPVNNQKDFDYLKELYANNMIPKQYRMNVYNFIYNNGDKFSLEESEVRGILNAESIENIFVSSDYHFYSEFTKDNDMNKAQEKINRIIKAHNNIIQNTDIFLFLGDIASKDFANVYNPLKPFITQLNGIKVLIKGNHDILSNQEYKEMGFDYVLDKLVWRDMIFSHIPIPNSEFPEGVRLNIHGDSHGNGKYYNMEPENHVDVFIGTYKRPISVHEARNIWKNKINDSKNKRVISQDYNTFLGESGMSYNNEWINKLLINNYLNEKALTSKERNNLPDSEFGIPELRKYPLTDKSHVEQAIRYFNKCPKKYEKELANNIKKKIEEYKMKPIVSKNNNFKKYYNK